VDAMPKVVLTADRTLLSDYNRHIFLGFAACAPKFLPGWLYTKIFCPPVEEDGYQVKFGHCGQRKIEAALLNDGFDERDIALVPPRNLSKVINEETKVLGVTTHDPLGLGPASTTFSDLANRETYTSYYFRTLMTNKAIKKHRLKIIAGGSGAWQLTDERIMAKFSIDSVVVGEGEITAVQLIKKALNEEPLPPIVEGEVVPLDQIPLIRKPTINGIIEITRGCGRGCKFCNPTMLNFRSQPLERILEEVRLNLNSGTDGVIFHGEDFLRYKTKGFVPNEKEVMRLFTETKKLTGRIQISHFAHASAAANPSLIKSISELMNTGSKECPFMSGQCGIETGSPRMVERHMKGKSRPFKPEEWPEMIIQSHGLLLDNHWVPCDTMIMGLPGETADDVRQSIDLVRDLSEFKSFIIPLFFIPIGSLKKDRFFRTKDMLPEHWELLAACIRHSLRWAYVLARENRSTKEMKLWKNIAIKGVIWVMDRRLNPYLKMMEEGIDPITAR
jgi:radical SAM superfamily enzyme YgiQ (UPF0313 family)